MKKLLIAIIVVLMAATSSSAFLYEIEILTQEQIKKLSDTELVEVYTEAKIEEYASSEFHQGAGFSSGKEYEKRKDLLRYIIFLRREMALRELESDPIQEWLE